MRIEEKDGMLVITDFDELEAYKIAHKIEQDGVRFYERLLSVLSDKVDRQALGFLAQKEREHARFFHKELLDLKERKEDSFEEDDLLSELEYGIFEPYGGQLEDIGKLLDTPAKALKLGLAIENRAIDFYSQCMQRVSSPAAKEAIANIIDEEREHKRVIEGMIARASDNR
jgi:rubrerythrin